MKKTYVTFGQGHFHNIMGQIFDPNTVAVIPCSDKTEGRALAFAIFGPEFCFEYHEDQFKQEHMQYFPKGTLEINANNLAAAHIILEVKKIENEKD